MVVETTSHEMIPGCHKATCGKKVFAYLVDYIPVEECCQTEPTISPPKLLKREAYPAAPPPVDSSEEDQSSSSEGSGEEGTVEPL